MNVQERPTTGDMYRCSKCEFEIHITNGCQCDDCTTQLQCCGQPLEKVTAIPVQNPRPSQALDQNNA
ncbi:hypothetical protein Pla22_25500 [Rubripirellula amarantea]|uniref:Desulfoferrodoxin N-terminal domain-containing protein n=1 Tax=Rubripirellula amarantea TaxID=2527999 RepID=A0A5C5WW30_9BACT|nr:hypothetical protein Pla22_25500 [Rubripirellula amarantea]